MRLSSFCLLALLVITSCKSHLELLDFYPNSSGELVQHRFYSLDYNEKHEQANWVIYLADHYGSAERSDNFKADPKVSTKSASLADYEGSGYDRGHLAPAADMSISELAMSESFYLSNMSPQVPAFNRGIWKKLEAQVRSWALSAKSTKDVVITGPLLDITCGEIGQNVSIPCSYFKIYADLESNKSIGFIIPNESTKKDLTAFVASIDSIEMRTGIDFFNTMNGQKQKALESQKNIKVWKWN